MQRTIREAVECRGVGLHTGEAVRLVLRPAPPDHGVVFRLLAEGVDIPARVDALVNGHYATTLGREGGEIQTVEHLLAAAWGAGVDNLLVEVDAREVPALDGSAAPFVTLLRGAGLVVQPVPRRTFRPARPVRVGDEHRWIHVTPGPGFRVTYTLDLEHPAVGRQAVDLEVDEACFVREIAPARTYGFLRDLERLRQQGLARGGSLANAVVVGEDRVLNSSLRFGDEFVRHKVLDLIGDLALLGARLEGHVVARNAGHALHHWLIREMAGAGVASLGAPPSGERRAPIPLIAG